MILSRLGNKKKMAKEIQKHFPPHKIYVEPFFGAGGMFFNKPKAHNNIVNDLDSDVFNLFQVVSNQKDELKEAFSLMPLHSDLMNYWKENKETEPIKKALRFLMLSNFGVYGLETFRLVAARQDFQYKFPELLEATSKKIIGTQFANYDFRKFLNSISFIKDGRKDEAKTFIYCDPPYLNTSNNYSDSFTEEDSVDLFDCLDAMNCKYAISEFDNEFILNQAKQRNLNIIIIGERHNIKNKRTEILVTNYENRQQSLFAQTS